MTTGLLVGCATALILVFAGNNDAAVMKGTLSWQIEVTAFFSYKSTADRDSMLQQILDVWKTKFDDKYQLYDEKITVVTELPGPEAFEQYKQLTFRISGKGPTGFNLKPLVSSFNTAITAAAIPGVELYLTSGSSTDGSTRFNVDVQANFVYSSSGARDRLLQQILALFKTQFASYSFTNLKIAVQSEQPSDVEGAKLLTFRISGQSSGDIDIKTLNTKFMAAIKTSKITGITLPESSGDTDEATTASTETDEGATSSNDTDEGTSATGGNKFTVTFNVVVKYNTQTELDAILQQILQIFKQKYGSLYGATQITIKVTGNKPNPSGGFSLTIVITGSSKTPINVTKVTKEFVTVVSSSKITGVQIVTGGSATGGGSGTSEEGGETEEGTTPKADTEEGTTLSSETEGGSTPKSETEEGTTPASGTEEGTTPASGTEEGTTPTSGSEDGTTPKSGTEEGTTPASGTEEGTTPRSGTEEGTTSASGTEEGTMPNSGTEDGTTPQAGTEEGTTPKTDTDEATTPKNDSEEGTTPQSKPDDGTSDSGNTFTLEYTVILRFVTPVQRDRLLQQILQLWIKTYGGKYGVVNPQITATGSAKPSTSVTGSFVVTYTITGTSSTPVPDTVKVDFNKVLNNAKISGVVVDEDTTQGDNSVEGSTGDGSSGDQEVTNTGRDLCSTVSVNQINGRTITRGTFSTNFTVYLTYKTASVRNDILQKLLAIWGDTLDQATKLKMCFYTEQLSIGKLEGGLVVNKVTYGISGMATVNFNTAAVAKVFEQAVADSSLQNVFFTTDFGDCSTKAVPDTNQFTITVSVIIKYKSQTELDTILQQILRLWIQKYGSIYGATRVTIKVTGKKPNPSGGFSLTIVISGSSRTVIDVTKVTKEFITVISKSKITGVTITTGGSVTGGGSATSEEGGETEEGTTPKSQAEEGTTPKSETEEGTTPKSETEEGTTPKSETNEGTTPSGNTDEGTTPKSHTGSTPQPDVDLDTTPKSGTEEGTTPNSGTEEGTTPKADTEERTTPQSKTEEGTTPSGETEEGTPSTGGNKFTVTVNVIVKYSTQTELDAILQQLLKIWIQKYGSLYGATHVTIKVTGKKPNPSGGFSLTIIITGSSKTVINVTKVTKEFVTVISSSKITGVQIITGGSVTGGGSGTSEEGGETEEGTTPKSETEEGTTPKSEAEEGTTPRSGTEEGTSPKTDSEEGTTPNSGTQEGTTPKSETEEGTTAKTDTEEGTTPKSGTEKGTTHQAGIEEGTTPQSKTEDGTTPSGETEEGTPSSGGNKFTVTVNVVIKYTTQTELDSILQQILKLWIKKYGSMYGATKVTIKVTGKKPNPAGGFSLTIVITGSSKTVIDVTKVTKEFITVISTSKITGVTISTGGSGTSEDGGETEEGTTPKSDAGEVTTPKTETEDGTTPKSDTEEGTTPKSEGGEGTTPKGDAEEGTTPQSKSEEGTTPGSDSGEETTPASTETTGGNSFKVTVTIVVTYKTQTELDSILQQILKLWIQKYGTKYGATGVTIKVGVKKPNPSGGYIISIIISGSSKTVVDVQTVSKQFITVISTAKITGVQVPDNETSGDDNEVTTAATEGDDTKGSGKKFTFDYTVTITYKTETEYNNLLQKILTIWIKHFGTKYGISGGKTVITGTPTPTSTKGKYTLHMTITGTYTTGTFDVDTVTSEFKVAITKNEIPGVTVSEEKEDGAATEAPEEGATPKADEEGATTAPSKETSEGSEEAVTPTAAPGIDKSGTDHDMEDVFGHSITLHFTRYITYTTEAQLKDILNQVYFVFMNSFGPTIQLTRDQHSEIHVYGTPKPTSVKTTFQVEFVITFWAKTTLSTTELETRFDGMLKESHVKGISTDLPSESTDDSSSDDDGAHDFELDLTLFIKYKTDAELQKKLDEILKVWIAKFGTEYQVTEQKIQLVGKPSSTSVKGIFQVHFTIDGTTTMFAKMTDKVVGKSKTPRFSEMLKSHPIAGVYLELPSSASDDSGNESDDGEDTEDNDANKVTENDNGGKFGVSENQKNGKTVGPGNFDVTLTVYLAYDTTGIRDNFLQRLLVIWRNSLNDYQVTNLKIEFEKDAMSVGKLPKDQGGAKVNKVWYRLTGSTVLAFNTAVVSKTFEQTVVDAHLGGVTFTLGAFGTKQA